MAYHETPDHQIQTRERGKSSLIYGTELKMSSIFWGEGWPQLRLSQRHRHRPCNPPRHRDSPRHGQGQDQQAAGGDSYGGFPGFLRSRGEFLCEEGGVLSGPGTPCEQALVGGCPPHRHRQKAPTIRYRWIHLSTSLRLSPRLTQLILTPIKGLHLEFE